MKPKCFDNLVSCVLLVVVACHHARKLFEINATVVVRVHLVEHDFDLVVRCTDVEIVEGSLQFSTRNRTRSVSLFDYFTKYKIN